MSDVLARQTGPAPAATAAPGLGGRSLALRAFGWGSSVSAVRLACSFLSIKVTAVVLGPAGLALVAQLGNLVALLQSTLGQALVTGSVRLAAEHADDAAMRARVRATALWLAVAVVGAAALALTMSAAPLARWLLADEAYAVVIALVGLAVAAAVWADLLHGALGVSKELGLIGRTQIGAALLGLAVFAPSAWYWGLDGALWASLAVYVLASVLSTALVLWRSKAVRPGEFFGRFDTGLARRLAGFYPMLVVNGALPPLALILVRDTLGTTLGLEAAGLWQATWRLSEAYQMVIVSSVTLVFMPALGERAAQPAAWRRQVLRTLGLASAATAALALVIGLLRAPIVHLVLSASFAPVTDLMPLQLVGDVFRVAGWILGMALVAALRTRWFVAVVLMWALAFVGGTRVLVPVLGLEAALWAYLAAGVLQTALAVWALRDRLRLP